jgi:hypothetical protein
MGLKFGTLDISDIKVGTSTVSKIYQGTNLIYPVGDTTPPSVPQNITGSNTSPNHMDWDSSTDDVTAQGNIQYFAERADNAGFSVNLVTFSNWLTGSSELDDVGPIVVVGNTYYYRVKARDEALNESAYSTTYSSTILNKGNEQVVYDVSSSANVCAIADTGADDTVYFTGGLTFATCTLLWDDAIFSVPSVSGYYGEDVASGVWRQWNGTTFIDNGICP